MLTYVNIHVNYIMETKTPIMLPRRTRRHEWEEGDPADMQKSLRSRRSQTKKNTTNFHSKAKGK
jgi:hypothetical protein